MYEVHINNLQEMNVKGKKKKKNQIQTTIKIYKK